jgi:hypothetical protein
MNEAKEGHGTLNWMLTFQSRHGGIVVKYHATEEGAGEEVDYLKTLGLTPVLWRRWA